jgi:hypothetical protein
MHASASVALPTFKIFCDILRNQCENPANPMFIHYLFESLAICTKVAASAGLHHEAEQLLLELLWSIISEPDHDFTPYALQVTYKKNISLSKTTSSLSTC